jgi:ABC-type proline/glycine betaine transport system ATPase subunit
MAGGEQQRIASAVAMRLDVLLCDEPTGALDSDSGDVERRKDQAGPFVGLAGTHASR